MRYKTLASILAALLILSLGLSYIQYDQKSNVEVELTELKSAIHLMVESDKLSERGLKAANFFDLASQQYDYSNYDLVITNCLIARDHASKHQQDIKELRYKTTGEGNLYVTYGNMLDEQMKIYSNLYEACEALESASRSYSVEDYGLGGSFIEIHNEKIAEHDRAVETHNDYLADFMVTLGELANE